MPTKPSYPPPPAGLGELIAALDQLAQQALASVQEKQPAAHQLIERQEHYTAVLLERLAAEGRAPLLPAQQEALQRVLSLRQQTQQHLAVWVDLLKQELVALNQNNRLAKQYQL